MTIFFFGLGGALWGWTLYLGFPKTNYPLTLPGAILLGFFGSLGFTIHSKDIRKILKSILLGIFGSIIGFFIAFLGIVHLPLILGFVINFFFSGKLSENVISFINLFNLPSLGIMKYLFNFTIAGLFIGLFFGFILKTNVRLISFYGAIGFTISGVISPIIGNIFGGLFNSVLAIYLITFFLIGIILGLFLNLGIHNKVKKSLS